VKRINITKDIATFQFSTPPEFEFKAGQFLFLGINGEKKPYSISSSPHEKDIVEITVKKVGKFSGEIFELEKGDNVQIKAPFGNMIFNEQREHSNVFISGGSGIGPFIGFIRYIRYLKLDNDVHLFYSARTPTEIEGVSRILGEPTGNEHYYLHATRPYLEPEKRWNGLTGRISMDEIKEKVPDFLDAHYYIVGPNGMVEGFNKELLGIGVNKENIHIERWG
jgi:ferredoxin-NADP reductase